MIRENLRKLWKDGEGRLLLINVSNQLENGTIGPIEIAPFLSRAKQSKVDFRSRSSALGYTKEELDRRGEPSILLKGPICDPLADETHLLRVAPFKSIIESVIFPNALEGLREEIIDDLSRFLNLDISQEAAREAETGIISNMRICAQTAGSATHWGLYPELAELGPVACNFGKRSLRFVDRAKGEPVFVAPVTGPRGSIVSIFGSASPGEAADRFRDGLGLDHLDRFYGDTRTVLGGILLRKVQVVGSTFHRPTPFDQTSRARFRAVHGRYGERPGSMGRSADLSLGGGASKGEGCAEIVAKDGHFSTEDSEVLIFYFGAVKNPRRDAYRPGQWENEDDAFVEGCLGGGRRLRALARVVHAACQVTR